MSSLLRTLRRHNTKEHEAVGHYLRMKKDHEKRKRSMGDRSDDFDEYLAEQQRQILSAVQGNTCVTDLIIDGSFVDSNTAMTDLDDLIAFTRPLMRLRNLRSVDISFGHLHFSLFRMIMEERQDLKELHVYWWDLVKFMTEADQAYLRSLPPDAAFSSLQTVSFENTWDYLPLMDDQKYALGSLLETIPRMPVLHSLELNTWQLTSLDNLVNLLANSSTLVSLSLKTVHLVDTYDYFGRNGLPDQWDILLVDALKSSSSLRRMLLDDINVSEDVLYRMASEALLQHPSLHTLKLVTFTACIYSPRVQASFLQLVQQNRSITDLTLDLGQKTNDNTMALIQCHVRLNQIHNDLEGSLFHDMLGKNTDTRVKALIHAYNDLGCLHLLLLQDPTVVGMGLACRPSTDSPTYHNADFPSIQRKRKRRLVPYREAISIA